MQMEGTYGRHRVTEERDAEVDEAVLEEQLPEAGVNRLAHECGDGRAEHEEVYGHGCVRSISTRDMGVITVCRTHS